MPSAVRASPPARRGDAARRPRRPARAPSAPAPRRPRARAAPPPERLRARRAAPAREQRRVDLEVRVLGGRADQRDGPLLDRGQERVLLGLVEAVDLVEEEDRAPAACAEPLAGAGRAPRGRRPTVAETAESSSNSAPVVSATIRASVVLPVPGGPTGSSDGTRSRLDRAPQRPARPDDVLLADELVERPRAQPPRERRRRRPAAGRRPPRRDRPQRAVCSGRGEGGLERGDLRSAGGSGERRAGRSARPPRAPGGRALARARDRRAARSRCTRGRAGADVTVLDSAAPVVERVRADAEEEGLQLQADVGSIENLPYDDAGFDVLVSDFGLIFAADHASVAGGAGARPRPERALGFTAWKPDPKLSELYRSFTDEPLEGRESSEWGREEHVELMLGEDFELDFHDGTLWIDAGSRRGAVGPALHHRAAGARPAREARRRRRRRVPPRVRRALRELPDGRRDPRAAAVPADHREAALIDEAVELLRELIRVDTSNPPGNKTAAAELLRGYLERAGVECELYAKEPGRANLVARITARAGRRRCPAVAHRRGAGRRARVERRPVRRRAARRATSGARRARHEGAGGRERGRARHARARGWRPRGDLVFVAAADEEVGDGFGARVARARAPGGVPRRLRDQRGRRRAGRDRRAACSTSARRARR